MSKFVQKNLKRLYYRTSETRRTSLNALKLSWPILNLLSGYQLWSNYHTFIQGNVDQKQKQNTAIVFSFCILYNWEFISLSLSITTITSSSECTLIRIRYSSCDTMLHLRDGETCTLPPFNLTWRTEGSMWRITHMIIFIKNPSIGNLSYKGQNLRNLRSTKICTTTYLNKLYRNFKGLHPR